MTGHNITQWLDGSPYAFQNWYQPSPQNAYHGREYMSQNIFQYFNPSKIQPQYLQTGICAAVFNAPTLSVLSAQWIAVPCQQSIPDATFICERKTISQQIRANKRILRHAVECPRTTINFTSCLRVINYVHKHGYKAEEVCYVQGMSVFHLPHFLLYLEPKVGWGSWSEENFFFLKFLISMTHRWPNVYDRNADKIDIIVGGVQNSSEKLDMFGVEYSESNLAHVHVVNISNRFSSKDLYILLCDSPMFISNGLCLHAHTMCNDGTCILSHYVCDGRADCPDASDEVECSHVCSVSVNYNTNFNCFFSCIGAECVCNDLYFPCALGGCVPWSRVCDGVRDCPHSEDEQQCYDSDMPKVKHALLIANNFQEKIPAKLKESDYKCINGSNISRVLVNDLVPDCPEQDDEEAYNAFLKNGSRVDFFPDRVLCKESDATTCVKNYKVVSYPRHLRCIHESVTSPRLAMSLVQKRDICRNGAHINNCELHTCPSYFKCPSSYCIPVYAVCNGRVDCPNGEDEHNCQRLSCPGFLLCRDDNLCVHPNDVWTSKVKCPVSMDDRAFHDADMCPTHCECAGNAIKCSSVLRLKLPKLQATLRILRITYTPFSLDDITWKSDLVILFYLLLSFCNITSIRAEHFSPLHVLRTLNLSNNLIHFLPKGLFGALSNVKEIDLGHNMIHQLHSGIFEGASKLRSLKIDSNKLTLVAPCTFGKLESLRILDLSNNYLSDIGDNIFCRNLKSYLMELYVDGNRIAFINNAIIVSHMQNLMRLNTAPIQICCFVPLVQDCLPKDKFYLSTCKHLLGSAFMYGIMISGMTLLFLSIGCIVWIWKRIMKSLRVMAPSGNTSINDILSVLLFTCHGFKGIHMVTLVCVETVLYNEYALYEQMWKRNPLCMLLNMFSYTIWLVSIFVFLLASYMRMLACVYPFKLGSVSASRPIWAIIAFFLVSFGVSYIPYSGIIGSHIDEPQMALGFLL